ncbi:GNAT family N-acetyltransferase [Streptomyces sp. NPDC003035]|uniref:GNAT family N-acetyltransferase n=1 Tax=Streptomyces sp. NPDC003035 TaxID=3364676 RepID=UPI0036B5B8BB
MIITVVRPTELGPAEADAWRTMLDDGPVPANPFLSPEFSRAVGLQRPAVRVAVLTEADRCVGFFPFERRPLGLGRPIGDGICDAQGLVHSAQLTSWDTDALLRACRLYAWQFDHLTTGQGPFEAGITHRAGSPVIDLSGAAEGRDLFAHCSVRFRRDARAKERRLARRAGDIRFVFHESDPDALEKLMAWKSAQYLAKGKPDLFSRPWVAETLRELHRTRSPACSGVLSVLYAGDRPVAYHFGLRSQHMLCHWFPVYDPDVATFSPGLLHFRKLVEAAAAAGLSRIDLGKDDYEWKTSVKTGDAPVAEGHVARATPQAALRVRVRHSELVRRGRGLVAANPVLRAAALRVLDRS